MTNATSNPATDNNKFSAADVVLGTGPLGQAVVAELVKLNRQPLVVNRSGGTVEGLPVVACNDGDLKKALASIPLERPVRLFMCAAPAYNRWPQEFPDLINSILVAIERRHCKLIHADNLYGCGASNQVYTEKSPLNATTVKGKVRAAAVKALMGLHSDDGPTQVAIVRASTMFGPGVEQSALGGSALRAARAGQPVPLLGNPGLPHSLTYVRDFARCMLKVSEQDQRMGHTWLVPNAPARSLRNWLSDFAPSGSDKVRERVAGRFLVGFMGLFNSQMRELKETLYQFENAHIVDSTYSEKTLNMAPTSVAEAIGETTAWLEKNPE